MDLSNVFIDFCQKSVKYSCVFTLLKMSKYVLFNLILLTYDHSIELGLQLKIIV